MPLLLLDVLSGLMEIHAYSYFFFVSGTTLTLDYIRVMQISKSVLIKSSGCGLMLSLLYEKRETWSKIAKRW